MNRTRRLSRGVVLAHVALASFVFSGACTDPKFGEASEATFRSCHNGADDDGDGARDCADQTCAPFCENSEKTCNDGVDNDRNGFPDCFDPSCRAMIACMTVDASCDAWTSEGCVLGLACYQSGILTSSPGEYCALPGTGKMGDTCTMHEECEARHLCTVGRCARRCHDHADCPKGSSCLSDKGVGVCSVPCVPAESDACILGICRPFPLAPYGAFPALTMCDGAAFHGALAEGASCVDGADDAQPDHICALPGICVVEKGDSFGAGRCRDTCALSTTGAVVVPCSNSKRTCTPAMPDDPREPLPGRSLLGLCLP